MGVYSKIKRLFTARTNQADKPFVSSYVGGDTIMEVKNLGVTRLGTLFPFNTTTTKPLKTRPNKWFDASEYFNSTIGLHTGYMVTIDYTTYVVRRVDRKRGKYWLSQQDTPRPLAKKKSSKIAPAQPIKERKL